MRHGGLFGASQVGLRMRSLQGRILEFSFWILGFLRLRVRIRFFGAEASALRVVQRETIVLPSRFEFGLNMKTFTASTGHLLARHPLLPPRSNLNPLKVP